MLALIFMRLVLISDTHEQHEKVVIPDGDVLVHAGDLTFDGISSAINEALEWMNGLPHKYIVMIAGNHDFAFERPHLKNRLHFGRVVYLENSSVNIEGVNFYGSPVQPWFMNWAFNVHRGAPIKKYWDMIPENTDVLITHGPPMGILDQSILGKTDHLGCEELIKQVEISVPKVHVFGHIHGGYGHVTSGQTKFYNASICNEAYQPVNQPFVVEI